MKLKLDYVDGKTVFVEVEQVIVDEKNSGFEVQYRKKLDSILYRGKTGIMYATLDGERIYPFK